MSLEGEREEETDKERLGKTSIQYKQKKYKWVVINFHVEKMIFLKMFLSITTDVFLKQIITAPWYVNKCGST